MHHRTNEHDDRRPRERKRSQAAKRATLARRAARDAKYRSAAA